MSTKDDAEVIDPASAVVLVRDGKHAIPYDRLEKARQGEQHWKAQAEQAQPVGAYRAEVPLIVRR